MVTFLAASYLLLVGSQSGGQGSLLQQIVPHVTGQNGFEEYLQAADLLRSPEYQKSQSKVEWLATGDDRAAYLAAAGQQVREFGKVLTLVRSGNAKDANEPTRGNRRLFPETMALHSVARFCVIAADVAFGSGHPEEGAKNLIDALNFSWHVRVGPLPLDFAGKTCQAIVLQGFNNHLPEIRPEDAAVIQSAVEARLSQPRQVAGSITATSAGVEEFATHFILHPDVADTDADGDGDRKTDPRILKIQSLTKNEQQQLYSVMVDRLNQALRTRVALLRKPMNQWGLMTRPSPDTTTGFDRLAEFAVLNHPSMRREIIAAEARHDLELRLLVVNLLLVQFHAKKGKLPTSLAELDAGEKIVDPLYGEAFQYEVDENGVFRLYSKGFSPYGEIDLTTDVPDVYEGDRETPPER